MREDYLWDKTGSDPAIERMENALRAFGYEENPQPVMLIPVAPPKRAFTFRFAPLAFAVAACVAIAVISWGVWRGASNMSPAEDQAAAGAPPIDPPPAHAPRKPEPPFSAVKDNPVRPEARQAALVTARPKIRRSRTVLRTIPAQPKPEFTREEIYAYNQLMLALSITSDKLGQVRDKAIGE